MLGLLLSNSNIFKVCKTWRVDSDERNYTDDSIFYFSEETQFAVFIVSKTVYNSAPTLISNRFISINEDEGIEFKKKDIPDFIVCKNICLIYF